MKRDELDHIPREILRQLVAGRLQIGVTHVTLTHLLACPACWTDCRLLLRGLRGTPLPRGDLLLSGWGREDHLDFETLRALVDLRGQGAQKQRSRHHKHESSGSADWWAMEHLAQCRLCQWAVDDLLKFVTAQREATADHASKGIPANQPRGRAVMGIHLRLGRRGWAAGSRWFFLPVGVGILLLLGELQLA